MIFGNISAPNYFDGHLAETSTSFRSVLRHLMRANGTPDANGSAHWLAAEPKISVIAEIFRFESVSHPGARPGRHGARRHWTPAR
jgi:hypothetical protein